MCLKLYIFSQYGHLNFPSGVLCISRSRSVFWVTLSLDVGDTLLGGMALGDGDGATGVPVDDVTLEFDAEDIAGCDVTGTGGGEDMTGSDGSGSDVIGSRFNGKDM